MQENRGVADLFGKTTTNESVICRTMYEQTSALTFRCRETTSYWRAAAPNSGGKKKDKKKVDHPFARINGRFARNQY